MRSVKDFPAMARSLADTNRFTRSTADLYGLARFITRNVRPEGMRGKRETTFAVNFSKWKRPFLERMFPNRRFIYIPNMLRDRFIGRLHRLVPAKGLFIWGMGGGPQVDELARRHDLDVLRFEDGFVRSVGLGSHHVPPMSLCLDPKGMHYDCNEPNRLDDILAHHDFHGDDDLMSEARDCLALMRDNAISKYNLPTPPSSRAVRSGSRKRVLCIGQVEDDQSIQFGCDRPIDNNDLVRFAAERNPDADILYKIHPDYAAGMRRPISDIADVADLCTIVDGTEPLKALFGEVDRVYTITSLSGFEALLHGVAVTTLGMPFYAGWGLTDDTQTVPQWRGRALTIEEMVAGAYILYPVYFDPETMERTTLRATIETIIASRDGVDRAPIGR